MKICYVGSFAVGSTESHWSAALEALGHEVIRLQEADTPWSVRISAAHASDLFVFTSTWGFAERWPMVEGFQAIDYLNARMPTCALHLDRWFGLSNREFQIKESAMFQVQQVFTADGDHDDEWRSAGVNHHWLPAGVDASECVSVAPRDEYESDVAFIGNWSGYGHREHADRRAAMLDSLRLNFGDRVKFWPRPGEPGPWGRDFNSLLSSVKVTVGDSWQGAERYWSNRIFEVVGRGGFCVHPAVPGLVDMLPEGFGVAYFPPGDWDAMVDTIEDWCGHDQERREAVCFGQQYVRERHSYTRRMETMLDVMRAEGAFS